MVDSDNHFRIIAETIANLIWNGTIIGLLLTAGFMVSPFMGFAMIATIILFCFRR